MIDLHCHLLPAIDDGPKTLSESLALARTAVESGIVTAVVTPHIQPGLYDNDRERIAADAKRFRAALADAQIPLQVHFGAEVRVSAELLTLVTEDRVPYLGRWEGERVLLLEFPHSHIPLGSDKLVRWLRERAIRPLIAHPERNKEVLRRPERITPFVQLGCLLQVTAGSLVGDFGVPARERAESLLAEGWVTVIASDAHNLRARPPHLAPGRKAAARIVGDASAWRMVRETPRRILYDGEPLGS